MSNKREISIGIFRPRILEGDIIYVNVKCDKCTGSLSAIAVSEEQFKYKNKIVKKADNEIGNSINTGYTIYSPYRDFIKHLEEENNAVVNKQRLFEDALDAYSLLEDIAQKSNERLKFSSRFI